MRKPGFSQNALNPQRLIITVPKRPGALRFCHLTPACPRAGCAWCVPRGVIFFKGKLRTYKKITMAALKTQ